VLPKAGRLDRDVPLGAVLLVVREDVEPHAVARRDGDPLDLLGQVVPPERREATPLDRDGELLSQPPQGPVRGVAPGEVEPPAAAGEPRLLLDRREADGVRAALEEVLDRAVVDGGRRGGVQQAARREGLQEVGVAVEVRLDRPGEEGLPVVAGRLGALDVRAASGPRGRR
jgi:hypothetical protein